MTTTNTASHMFTSEPMGTFFKAEPLEMFKASGNGGQEAQEEEDAMLLLQDDVDGANSEIDDDGAAAAAEEEEEVKFNAAPPPGYVFPDSTTTYQQHAYSQHTSSMKRSRDDAVLKLPPQVKPPESKKKKKANSSSLGSNPTTPATLSKSKRNGIELQRVQNACNHCRRGKISCDDVWPCTRCVKKGIDCVKEEHLPRGRKPKQNAPESTYMRNKRQRLQGEIETQHIPRTHMNAQFTTGDDSGAQYATTDENENQPFMPRKRNATSSSQHHPQQTVMSEAATLAMWQSCCSKMSALFPKGGSSVMANPQAPFVVVEKPPMFTKVPVSKNYHRTDVKRENISPSRLTHPNNNNNEIASHTPVRRKTTHLSERIGSGDDNYHQLSSMFPAIPMMDETTTMKTMPTTTPTHILASPLTRRSGPVTRSSPKRPVMIANIPSNEMAEAPDAATVSPTAAAEARKLDDLLTMAFGGLNSMTLDLQKTMAWNQRQKQQQPLSSM